MRGQLQWECGLWRGIGRRETACSGSADRALLLHICGAKGAPARAVDTAHTPSGASILAGGLTTLPIFDHGQHHFLQEDIQINQLQNTSPRVWQPPFFSQRADLGGVL